MAITTNVGKILMMPKGQWLNNVTYYYLDLVTYNGTKWLCKKESCIGMEPSNGSEYWYPWDEADVGGSVVDFTVATTRTDIQPGETIAILFGKIKKWLIDLKTVAFTGKMEDMVELTKASTTELGCVKVDGDTITVDENGVIKGNSKVTVDNQLSTTSENPVMNRVITAKINELEEEIGSGDAIIAENYSATTSYVANDEVIYNGELWRCKLACVGTTPAEGTYWTKTTVGNELKTINSDLSELKSGWTLLGTYYSGDTITFPNNCSEVIITPCSKSSTWKGNSYYYIYSDIYGSSETEFNWIDSNRYQIRGTVNTYTRTFTSSNATYGAKIYYR